MRNYNLLLLFTFIIFCWNCADNLEMDEVEQTAAEAIIMHYVAPPPAGNYLDSMRMAFVNAIEVSGEGNIDIIYNGTLEFREDYSFIAVVHYSKDSSKRIIYVNELLIREYTWEGYLLIALHEWFHLNQAPSYYNNDQGHAYMVVSTEYRIWIKRIFDCSDEEARWLAYVGTENTIVYNNLSAEEKLQYKWCVNDLRLNVKNRFL